MSYKSFSCCGPTFGNISLTEKMTDLLIAWKLNQNDCNDLYLHNKPFKTALKSNHIWCQFFVVASVNPSTPTLPNINLTKGIRNLLVV